MFDIDSEVIDRLVVSLHSSLMDMREHSYNGYKDDDERIVYLTVGDIKHLYETLTGDVDW